MSRGKRFLICVNREKTKQERNFLNFSVAGRLAEKKLFYPMKSGHFEPE